MEEEMTNSKDTVRILFYGEVFYLSSIEVNPPPPPPLPPNKHF